MLRFDISCLLIALSLSTLAVGCAHPLEKPRVAERFRELHGCEPDHIYAQSDRWVAEGCGVVAHYTCLNKYQDNDESALWGSDTCVEEAASSREPPASPPREVSNEPTEKNGSLRVAVPLGDAWLIALGEPQKTPERALVAYRAPAAPSTSECGVRILIDGKALATPLKLRKVGGQQEQHFRVSVEELESVARAARVSVDACGQITALSGSQRDRFRSFASRFLEVRGASVATTPDAGPVAHSERRQ